MNKSKGKKKAVPSTSKSKSLICAPDSKVVDKTKMKNVAIPSTSKSFIDTSNSEILDNKMDTCNSSKIEQSEPSPKKPKISTNSDTSSKANEEMGDLDVEHSNFFKKPTKDEAMKLEKEKAIKNLHVLLELSESYSSFVRTKLRS